MTDSAVARRLRTALAMYEFGENMYRARIRREHPDATDDDIELLVASWRLDRPGAPHGDSVGRPTNRWI